MNSKPFLPQAARLVAPGLLLAVTAACTSAPARVSTLEASAPPMLVEDPVSPIDPPVAIHTVRPDYPIELRRAGVTDTVMVQCWINDAGKVEKLTTVNSPNYLLAQSARKAVKDWSFQPAMRDGVPTGTRVNVPIVFTLNP